MARPTDEHSIVFKKGGREAALWFGGAASRIIAMKATLEEVEQKASEYLHRVIDGERVVVYRGGQPVAEIRPMSETETLRPAGLAAGEFVVPDDFDDPLPEDLLDAFEGR